MKRILLSALTVAIVCGALVSSASAQQGTRTPTTRGTALPHKIGLIDIAKVFKKYKKFDALRESLRAEIQRSDEQAKAMATQLQKLQEQLKASDPGSAGYLQYEKEFAQKKSDFEAFRAVAQRDFMRKEAQIYKTVYLEVVDAVRKYAYHYQYSLIMRFNSEKLDASDPQKLIQGLQRPVIYHRSEDDITASVIDYLNRNYTASSSSAKSPSTTRSR